MVLAHSNLEQLGDMYPSLVYMTISWPKHVLDVVLAEGVRVYLSIEPTWVTKTGIWTLEPTKP